MKAKAKHTKSQFTGEPDEQPNEISAHEDRIEMEVTDSDGFRHTITLRPRHLLAIKSMYDDWWESHWAAVHEEGA